MSSLVCSTIIYTLCKHCKLGVPLQNIDYRLCRIFKYSCVSALISSLLTVGVKGETSTRIKSSFMIKEMGGGGGCSAIRCWWKNTNNVKT